MKYFINETKNTTVVATGTLTLSVPDEESAKSHGLKQVLAKAIPSTLKKGRVNDRLGKFHLI